MEAVHVPFHEGEKPIAKVQLAPGAKLAGHVFVCENCERPFVSLIVIPVMTRPALPLLESVTLCVGLVVPTV